MQFKGIDVSTWQGTIDWKKVENSEIHFAMIRSSYGSSGVDAQFKNNIINIKSTNIHPGAYHYTYAKTLATARTEANHFLSVISPYKFTYPVALDLEDSSLVQLGKNTITDIALTFCDIVKNAGYHVCIYSNPNWLYNYIDTSKLSDFDIWLAQWNNEPTYKGDFGIWQYSATGKINGISGDVDLNLSYKDYANIIINDKTNSDNTPSTPENNNPSPTKSYYTVVAGDTLWDIAKKFLGNGSRYKEIMSANNLSSDVIQIGQKLLIPNSSGSSKSYYTVVAGDTLWDIAKKFLGDGSRYKEIMSANNLSSDVIQIGQKLLIP